MVSLAGIILTITSLIILLTGEALAKTKVVRISKPLASLGFLIAAIGFGALDSLYGYLILIALIFSFAGDVLLLPKSSRYFYFGIISFGTAHIIFAIAFILPGINIVAAITAAVILAGLLGYTGFWIYPHLSENMRTIVIIYLIVIGAMTAIAGGSSFNGGPVTIFIGAVLFAISDLAVARNRFVSPGFSNKIWGLPLYYSAQLILASTVGVV